MSRALIAETPLAQLALELATGLYPPTDVLRNHGVTKVEAKALLGDPQFRSMVNEYRKLWNSPLNATERVRLKSAVAVEDGLIELYALYQDVKAHPQSRLEAFKQLVTLSDLAPKPNAVATGERFHLTINLPAVGGGQEAKTITIDAETPAALLAGSAGSTVGTAGADPTSEAA